MRPAPYPQIVRDFQSVIGRESRKQMVEQTGSLPDNLVACVGGDPMLWVFLSFLNDSGVSMYGVEAGGHGISTGKHAAPLNDSKPVFFMVIEHI